MHWHQNWLPIVMGERPQSGLVIKVGRHHISRFRWHTMLQDRIILLGEMPAHHRITLHCQGERWRDFGSV